MSKLDPFSPVDNSSFLAWASRKNLKTLLGTHPLPSSARSNAICSSVREVGRKTGQDHVLPSAKTAGEAREAARTII
jgi:hypothetical protein